MHLPEVSAFENSSYPVFIAPFWMRDSVFFGFSFARMRVKV